MGQDMTGRQNESLGLTVVFHHSGGSRVWFGAGLQQSLRQRRAIPTAATTAWLVGDCRGHVNVSMEERYATSDILEEAKEW